MSDFASRRERIRAQQASAPSEPPTWLAVMHGIFGDCIGHEHEQVGRCVYCKPCGRRLYQGTVMPPDELAELRAAMEADHD